MQTERETLRDVALAHLAMRSGVAQSALTIALALRREGHAIATVAETEAALDFLAGLNPPLVTAKPAPLGSTIFYQVSSDGTLFAERQGLVP